MNRTNSVTSNNSNSTALPSANLDVNIGDNCLINALYFLVPMFRWRAKIYFFLTFILSLYAIGSHQKFEREKSFLGLGLLIIIDTVSAFIDEFVFFLVDYFFHKYYDIVYSLQAFHGPLSIFLTLFAINYILVLRNIESEIPKWDDIIKALVAILVCYCLKLWIERRYYSELLIKRFSSRLAELDAKTKIISHLSTNKPPLLKKRGNFSELGKFINRKSVTSDTKEKEPASILKKTTDAQIKKIRYLIISDVNI